MKRSELNKIYNEREIASGKHQAKIDAEARKHLPFDENGVFAITPLLLSATQPPADPQKLNKYLGKQEWTEREKKIFCGAGGVATGEALFFAGMLLLGGIPHGEPEKVPQKEYSHHLDKQDTIKVVKDLSPVDLERLGLNATWLDDNLTNYELRGMDITYWSNGDVNASGVLKNLSEQRTFWKNGSGMQDIGAKIKAAYDAMGRVVETSSLNGIKPGIFPELDDAQTVEKIATLEREGYFNKTLHNGDGEIQELINRAPGLGVLSYGLNADKTDPTYIEKIKLFDTQDNGNNESDDGSLAFAWDAQDQLVKIVMLDKNNTRGWVLYGGAQTASTQSAGSNYVASDHTLGKMAGKMQKRFGADAVVAYDQTFGKKAATVMLAYDGKKVAGVAVKFNDHTPTKYFSLKGDK